MGATRIRVLASNLTSGDHQSYEAPGKRILQGLEPDIVLIQEFNVDGSTDTFVDDTFGEVFAWHREAGSEQIPNGVISRWPIIASGDWNDSEVSNRDFAWVKIDIPGDKDLWAVSVHFLTSGSSVRSREASALVSYINANVPEGDYLLVGGDFNTDNRSEGCISNLSSVVVTASPYPADQSGNGDTNAGRDKPYDWVLADSDFDALETPVVIGSNSFTNGLVFDSRVYNPLSDVSPVLRNDSGVSGMQHMAVVRDFLVDDGVGDDFTVSPTEADFGTVDAGNAPFTDSSVTLDVKNAFTLNSVTFTGNHSAEFQLTSPDLSGGGVNINSDVSLEFRWNPESNDGASRTVTASFTTNGSPSNFDVTLTGQVGSPPGEPLDISGWEIHQDNTEQIFTVPANTLIQPGGFVIIGRQVSKSSFESYWSATLGSNVIYFNGNDVIGGNGFPVMNGDETFKVLDALDVQIDPPTGTVPSGGVVAKNAYHRASTDSVTFTTSSSPDADGTPGAFSGEVKNTGNLVITEINDPANYEYEFIELFYDAKTPPPAKKVLWLFW